MTIGSVTYLVAVGLSLIAGVNVLRNPIRTPLNAVQDAVILLQPLPPSGCTGSVYQLAGPLRFPAKVARCGGVFVAITMIESALIALREAYFLSRPSCKRVEVHVPPIATYHRPR